VNSYPIREIEPTDSIDELTHLLHEAYAELAEHGMRFLASHQSSIVTQERINRGQCFVVTHNFTLIGTVTLYAPGSSDECTWYARKDVCSFGQLAVKPQYRGRGIATALIAHCESYAKALGARELALDTAETADRLLNLYTRLGFRFIQYAQWDMTNYRSIVLSKLLI
jgi:GNAT superfamily N-acetyltransferase